MIHKQYLTEEIIKELDKRTDGLDVDIEIPPAVFIEMKGSLAKFDKTEQSLLCHFPVLENHLNPFGNMQGGIISAAIDNTIGPLSLLVANPSVTRHLEVKFKKAITPDINTITIKARLQKQNKRFLFFIAEVTDADGTVFASAKSTHFILSM